MGSSVDGACANWESDNDKFQVSEERLESLRKQMTNNNHILTSDVSKF